MRFILVVILAASSLLAQSNKQQVMIATGVDAPNTPTDSPGMGTYSSTQSVTLSDATAQYITYTVDGSTPNCLGTNGTLYTGAFNISATTTLKAIGCNGITGGGVLTSVYTITGASAPSVVQTCTIVASGTSGTCTFGSSVTAGDAVIIGYGSDGSSTLSGCTDTASNSYPSGKSQAWIASTRNSAVYYAKNVTGSFTVVTCAVSSSDQIYGVGVELSGANTSTPLDLTIVSAASADASGTAADSGSSGTTNFNDRILGVIFTTDSGTPTVGSGFTSLTHTTAAARYALLEGKAGTSGTAYNATATLSMAAWWASYVITVRP